MQNNGVPLYMKKVTYGVQMKFFQVETRKDGDVHANLF